MTHDQMVTFKKNYIENKELEFVCKTGKEPTAATITKWGQEADQRLREWLLILRPGYNS